MEILGRQRCSDGIATLRLTAPFFRFHAAHRAKFSRSVAVVTLLCFLITSVFGPSAHALAGAKPEPKIQGETADDCIIAPTAGIISDARFLGSRQVVVQIQDLHCHPEVQRNITEILRGLDRNYGIENVYVEGGHGAIHTSWLCNIKDTALRTRIVENLVDQGRLTGSERYSVMSRKPELLKGLEKEEVHRANIVRLGKLLERKEYYEIKTKELREELEYLKAKHFNAHNKKFDRLVEKYEAGKIEADKFYLLLGKYAGKINADSDAYNAVFGITLEDYANIKKYLQLSAVAKRLKYGDVSRQLQSFLKIVKEKLPYDAYRDLLDKTENLSRQDELCRHLARMAKEYAFNLENDFPDLKKYFEYAEMSGEINPTALVQEERRLVEEIRLGLSLDSSELEVSFLTDFYAYFEEYLLGRLSAEDYAYFSQKFGQFQLLWSKYAFKNGIDGLSDDFKLLDEYYQVNCARNICFLQTIGIDGDARRPATGNRKEDQRQLSTAAIHKALRESKIVVVVAGGFHTRGLKELLAEHNVSYLVITPQVTRDTRVSSELYAELARQQAKVLSNALALGLASQATSSEMFELAITAAGRDLRGGSFNEENVRHLIEALKEAVGEAGIAATDFGPDRATVTFSNGRSVTLTRNGDGEAFKILAEFAGQAQAAARESIVQIGAVVFGTETVVRDVVGLANLVPDTYSAAKHLLEFAARHRLVVGEGLVREIQNDEELQPLLDNKLDGVRAELLARFPEFMQRMAADRQKRLMKADEKAERAQWLKALLAVDVVRDFVACMGVASPALQDAGDTAAQEAFDREMEGAAAERGIAINDGTRIALYIGGPHIADRNNGYYYRMFETVLRKNYGFDLIYLPFVAEKGDDKRIVIVKEQLRKNRKIVGAVITRPWKEAFGDERDGIGAGCYVVRDRETNRLTTAMTDGESWVRGLGRDLGREYDFAGKKIVFIGSGGAARGIAEALNGRGIERISFVDSEKEKLGSFGKMIRTLGTDYQIDFIIADDVEGVNRRIKGADIVINATGIGRGKTKGESPVKDHSCFHQGQIVSDLISNVDTRFLQEARAQGVERTFNGRSMFIHGMVLFMRGWLQQMTDDPAAIPSFDDIFGKIDDWLKTEDARKSAATGVTREITVDKSRDAGKQRNGLSHGSTFRLWRAVFGFFGWKPLTIVERRTMDRVIEKYIAPLWIPDIIVHTLWGRKNKYQKWGAAVIWGLTAVAGVSAWLSRGLTAATIADAYLVNAMAHYIYNQLFGSGTKADSPLAGGDTRSGVEVIPGRVLALKVKDEIENSDKVVREIAEDVKGNFSRLYRWGEEYAVANFKQFMMAVDGFRKANNDWRYDAYGQVLSGVDRKAYRLRKNPAAPIAWDSRPVEWKIRMILRKIVHEQGGAIPEINDREHSEAMMFAKGIVDSARRGATPRYMRDMIRSRFESFGSDEGALTFMKELLKSSTALMCAAKKEYGRAGEYKYYRSIPDGIGKETFFSLICDELVKEYGDMLPLRKNEFREKTDEYIYFSTNELMQDVKELRSNVRRPEKRPALQEKTDATTRLAEVSGLLEGVVYASGNVRRYAAEVFVQNNRFRGISRKCSGNCPYCYVSRVMGKIIGYESRDMQTMGADRIAEYVDELVRLGYNAFLAGEDTLDDLESFWAVARARKAAAGKYPVGLTKMEENKLAADRKELLPRGTEFEQKWGTRDVEEIRKRKRKHEWGFSTNGWYLVSNYPQCDAFFRELKDVLGGDVILDASFSWDLGKIGQFAARLNVEQDEIYRRMATVIVAARRYFPKSQGHVVRLFEHDIEGIGYVIARRDFDGTLRREVARLAEEAGYPAAEFDFRTSREQLIGVHTPAAVHWALKHRVLKPSDLKSVGELYREGMQNGIMKTHEMEIVRDGTIVRVPMQTRQELNLWETLGEDAGLLDFSTERYAGNSAFQELARRKVTPASLDAVLSAGINNTVTARNMTYKQIGFALALSPDLKDHLVPFAAGRGTISSTQNARAVLSYIYSDLALKRKMELLLLLDNIITERQGFKLITVKHAPEKLLGYLLDPEILSAYLEFYCSYSNDYDREDLVKSCDYMFAALRGGRLGIKTDEGRYIDLGENREQAYEAFAEYLRYFILPQRIQSGIFGRTDIDVDSLQPISAGESGQPEVGDDKRIIPLPTRKPDPSGPRELVLPRNRSEVLQWRIEGRPDWWIALRVALRERFASFFGFPAFYSEHGFTPEEQPAGWMQFANYAPVVAGAVIVPVLALSGFGFLSLAAVAAGTATGIIAGGIYHWVRDTRAISRMTVTPVNHVIRSGKLAGAIAACDNTPALTHIWYCDLPAGTAEKLAAGFRISIPGGTRPIDVWTGVKGGALVFYLDVRKAGIPEAEFDHVLNEGAMQIIRELNGNGDSPLRRHVHDFWSRGSGRNGSHIVVNPGITVDHAGTGRKRAYNGIGSLVISPDALTDDNDAVTGRSVNEKLGDLVCIRNAESCMMAQNLFLNLDDVNDIDEFKRSITAIRKAGNGQVILQPTVLESIGNLFDARRLRGKYEGRYDFVAGKTAEIARLAERNGVRLFVDLRDCPPAAGESKKRFFEKTGIAGYVADEANGRVKVYDFSLRQNSDGQVIRSFKNPDELRDCLRNSRAACKIVNSSELKRLFKGDIRSVMDKMALIEVLRFAAVSLYDPEEITAAQLSNVAEGWDWERLPQTPGNVDDAIAAIENRESTVNEILDKMGMGRGVSHAVRTYVLEKLADDVKGTSKESELEALQREFLRAVAKEMLARDKLVAAGKINGLADRDLQRTLADALYEQKARKTEGAGMRILPQTFMELNDVPADQFYSRFDRTIHELRADGSPEAINAQVELIPQLGEPKMQQLEKDPKDSLNINSIDAILEAA